MRAIQYGRQWVAEEINPLLVSRGQHPVTRMLIVTGKNEKGWERAYGFKLRRRIMSLALDEEPGEEG